MPPLPFVSGLIYPATLGPNINILQEIKLIIAVGLTDGLIIKRRRSGRGESSERVRGCPGFRVVLSVLPAVHRVSRYVHPVWAGN